MIELDEVTAIVVGSEVPSTIFPNGIAWDVAAGLPDMGSFTRFLCAQLAKTPLVYFQASGREVAVEDQNALMDAYEDGKVITVDGTLDGGALLDRGVPLWIFGNEGVDPADEAFWPRAEELLLEKAEVIRVR